MPHPHQIAAFAEDYLRRVNDRVRNWIHRTSFTEGPELWREEAPRAESPVVTQPPQSVMQWVTRAMFGSPTPATPVHVPRYEPAHRWNNGERSMAGSIGSEAPFPRAQYQSRQQGVPGYPSNNPAQVGLGLVQPCTSTFMKPRAAPAPPVVQPIQAYSTFKSPRQAPAPPAHQPMQAYSTFKNPRPAPAPPAGRSGQGQRVPTVSSNYDQSRSSSFQSTPVTDVQALGFSAIVARQAAKPQDQFSTFSFHAKTPSHEDDWLTPGSVEPPDTPHSGNTIAMPSSAARSTLFAPTNSSFPDPPMKKLPLPAGDHFLPHQFADSIAASEASVDTIGELVEDLAADIDAQLESGRQLKDIVAEWEGRSGEVKAASGLGAEFDAMLDALKDQVAEEEEMKATAAKENAHQDAWLAAAGKQQGGQDKRANAMSTWGLRTHAKNERRVARQLLEEELEAANKQW